MRLLREAHAQEEIIETAVIGVPGRQSLVRRRALVNLEGELGEGGEAGKTLGHCIEEASVAQVEEAQRSPQGVGT